MKRLTRWTLLLVIPLLAIGLAGWLWITGGRFVGTENAYLRADKTAISADVSGRISHLWVTENASVQAGQPLFQVDEAPYRIALQQAQALVADVQRELEGLQLSYREKLAALELAKEQAAYQDREYNRQRDLHRRDLVAKSVLDEAAHGRTTARLQVITVEKEAERLRAELGGQVTGAVEKLPRYLQALAQRDSAALNLQRTKMLAPADGVVGPLTVQVGEYVQPGQNLFSIVGAELWVEANLKETELTNVRTGQSAAVEVDAYPGRSWAAQVTSISPATGAEFALLPAQNASGNWVKVVQRVPVRVDLVRLEGDPPLVTGMSVSVEIDSGKHREMPAIVTAVLGSLLPGTSAAGTGSAPVPASAQ